MHIATVVLSLSSLVGILTRNRRNHPNAYVTANNRRLGHCLSGMQNPNRSFPREPAGTVWAVTCVLKPNSQSCFVR